MNPRRLAVIGAALAGVVVAAGMLAARPRPAPAPVPGTGVDWERELWDRSALPVEPAMTAPAAPRSARAPQHLLTARGTVTDPVAVAHAIVAWVANRGGLATLTKGQHIAVKVPAAVVPELFAQFPELQPSGPAPHAPGGGALWVNLSIQLDPSDIVRP